MYYNGRPQHTFGLRAIQIKCDILQRVGSPTMCHFRFYCFKKFYFKCFMEKKPFQAARFLRDALYRINFKVKVILQASKLPWNKMSHGGSEKATERYLNDPLLALAWGCLNPYCNTSHVFFCSVVRLNSVVENHCLRPMGHPTGHNHVLITLEVQ